jgi:hypothetical protein
MKFKKMLRNLALVAAIPVALVSMNELGYRQRLKEENYLQETENAICYGAVRSKISVDTNKGKVILNKGDPVFFRSMDFGWYDEKPTIMVKVNLVQFVRLEAEIPYSHLEFSSRRDLGPLINDKFLKEHYSRDLFDNINPKWADRKKEYAQLIGINDFQKGKSDYTGNLISEYNMGSKQALVSLAAINDSACIPGLVDHVRFRPQDGKEVGNALLYIDSGYEHVMNLAVSDKSCYIRKIIAGFGVNKHMDFFLGEFDEYPDRTTEILSSAGVKYSKYLYNEMLGKIMASKDSCSKINKRIKALEKYANYNKIERKFYHACIKR